MQDNETKDQEQQESIVPFDSLEDIKELEAKAEKSDTRLVRLSAGSYPWARGNFEIDNYLNALTPHQACWINGDTVNGDIYIGDQNWGTYTRPIFAYLDYTGRKVVPENYEIEYTFTQKRGFSYSFTQEVKVSYSVGANIEIVNLSSNIEVGFSATQTWSQETEQSWKTTMKGPATFYCYQIHVVYAHCATTAANKFPNAFPYHRINTVNEWRKDLYYLSDVNKSTMVVTTSPVTPLTWQQVQQYVLFDNWNSWNFDYSAYDDPRRRY